MLDSGTIALHSRVLHHRRSYDFTMEGFAWCGSEIFKQIVKRVYNFNVFLYKSYDLMSTGAELGKYFRANT